jgi:glycosyltransferase involved in cell wall biosynthesis
VGDGPDLAELKELSVRLQVQKYVQFTGFVQDEECDHFYANMDLLVFPTYFDEGFPMVLFKSIVAGLPVITTATRAAIDYLKEPDNLLWVEPRSPKDVAQAIDRLLEDREMRENMKNHNLALAQQFNQLDVCSGMVQAFESLR